ncbi:cilia- and flagella-associated protein 97 isoform X2 [Heptranchias perlo]|uniref:cilia- and flagella-associated protein 97 isoform X2 n=1 Tax=Heptranchias perlo TaxID=212740 RepID=UPI00355AB2F9
MDSDTNLDGEVDHSFFDSDGEQEGRRSPGTARGREAPPSSSVNGSYPGSGGGEEPRRLKHKGERSQGAAGKYSEDILEDRGRPGSSSSSSSPPTSLSSSSAASVSPSSSSSGKGAGLSGEPRMTITRSPNSSGDQAGSSDDGNGKTGARPQSDPGSQRRVPGKQWSHSRSNEAAHSDPASNSDSDMISSTSDCPSSSPSGKRSSAFPKSQRRPKSCSKSRKGQLKGFCQGKNEGEASEGTVTDVTPLSSPDISPIHSVNRCKESKGDRKKSSNKQENISQAVYSSLDTLSFDGEKGQGVEKPWRQRQQREARSCNVSSKEDSLEPKGLEQRHSQKILNDATDLNQLLKAMMHLEKKELRKIVADFPTQRYRKNYTFSNEETKRIDRENQRLLQELTRKATKPTGVTPKKSSAPTVRVYHSTLNRQREQERIEKENLAFLKRLEAVKPTVGLKRSNQLLDYQRQMSFVESYSQRHRPSTSGSMSRLSSRSSSHKNIQPVSNSSA